MRSISVLLALFVFVFSGCSALAAGPWKGRVIDAETKEPLEGAVVLAVWDRNYRTPTGTSSYFYEVKEVLTDNDGRFEIPSYISINLLPIISYIKGPEFIVFKPGYGQLHMAFGDYLTDKQNAIKEFILFGNTYRLSPGVVELPRLKTREERRMVLPSSDAPFRDNYNKKKNYMLLLNRERVELGLEPYPIMEVK